MAQCLAALTLMLSVACESDYSYRPAQGTLAFSADTLSFDTIFSGAPTPAAALKLYNLSGENITIDRLWLSGGTASRFKVNINGVPDTEATGIRLAKGDSLHVFVMASLPETDADEPFETIDALHVTSGSCNATATLIAYGQNVTRIGGKISACRWQAGRPYLITSTITVDSAATLTIEAGTRVYAQQGTSIDVKGSIHITGTAEHPVFFGGCRREAFYSDIPGQWGGINICASSAGNHIEHAEVAHAQYALTVDSAASVTLRNVVLRDASHGAVLSYGAKVDMANALLYNCGGPLVAMYGGECTVVHSTLSNYFAWDVRHKPTLTASALSQYPAFGKLRVVNSIIVGNQTDEMALDSLPEGSALLSHSYIRLSRRWKTDDDSRFDAVLTGNDPKFASREEFCFALDSLSDCIGTADPEAAQLFPTDLIGNSRLADGKPDIGAIEWMPLTDD